MKEPKIMGSCLHSACRDCIEEYVASLGRRARDAFSCPVCRQKCKIPQNRIADLKDHFKLASIIDCYRRIKDTPRLKCSENDCANAAESLCETCHVLLCSGCTEDHDIYTPGNHEHEIVAICSLHGSSLTIYCKACEQAICILCKLSSHTGGGHDVISYFDAVEDTSAKVVALLTKLDKEESELSRSLSDVVTKTEGYKVTNEKGAIARGSIRLDCLRERSRNIQRRIKALKNQKETLDEMSTLLTELRNEETGKQNKVLIRSEKCQENIKDRLKSLHVLSSDVKKKLKLVPSRKTPLVGQNAETFKSLRQELTKYTEVGNTTLIEEVRQLMDELEPTDADMVTVTDDFSTVKTVVELSFPKARPCREVLRVQSLPDGRLVVLGRSSMWGDALFNHLEGAANTLYLFNDNGTVSKILTAGVYPATDMSVLPTGEVLLLNRGPPSLRLMNIDCCTFHEIVIPAAESFSRRAKIWSAVIDKDGNTFVDFGESPHQYLFVLKADGTIIQSKDSGGFVSGIPITVQYTRRVFDTAGDRLVRFDGSDLREFVPFLIMCTISLLVVAVMIIIQYLGIIPGNGSTPTPSTEAPTRFSYFDETVKDWWSYLQYVWSGHGHHS